MSYDPHDTIAAIASAPGGAARGVVRISGTEIATKLATCFTPECVEHRLERIGVPQRISGIFHAEGDGASGRLEIPGQLLLWPSRHSYTRQPSAEFHTIGSPPLLAAVLEELSRRGIRPAEPGEFTLRAFLAGRIDLTQAEAVLGVIDARDRSDLDAALDQLAGGLSRPLHCIREQLLAALAELEAGLDFAEEDIEFISRAALRHRLAKARSVVKETLSQMATRDVQLHLPRIVIVGPPNAGKSSLFNAILERFGDGTAASAIVSPEPGATRDYVTGRIIVGNRLCELVDTAGEVAEHFDNLQAASQEMTARQRGQADLRLRCSDATCPPLREDGANDHEIYVQTKSDLAEFDHADRNGGDITCSSATGEGLDDLLDAIRTRPGTDLPEGGRGALAAATASRCTGSLRDADDALRVAIELTSDGGDELIAAEIRSALDSLGQVVGTTSTDNLLDRIFSQFCIGK
jgi:tRNA modification GTPase